MICSAWLCKLIINEHLMQLFFNYIAFRFYYQLEERCNVLIYVMHIAYKNVATLLLRRI